MNTRTSTLGMVGFMLALAFALPIAMGSLYTAWRARVTAGLPQHVETVPPAPRAPPAPIEPGPVVERLPPPDLRPVDKQMFRFAEFPLPEPERQDLLPNEKYRIDLVKEAKGSLATGAKLDLDRDGHFDEIWTFGRPILRDVSPADDGNYAEHYRWEHREWVKAVEEPAR